jgi:hypothetical protein
MDQNLRPCVPNAVSIFQVVDFSDCDRPYGHVLFTVVSPNSLRFRLKPLPISTALRYLTQGMANHRTRFARHPHLPSQKSEKCNPSVRYECHLCLGPVSTCFWDGASGLCPGFTGFLQNPAPTLRPDGYLVGELVAESLSVERHGAAAWNDFDVLDLQLFAAR